MDANDTTYEGWFIRTVTGIDNPDDWKRGDPDRYIVRGVAEFPPLDPGADEWTSIAPITAESRHFANPVFARRFHAEVAVKLQQLIDERRPAVEGWGDHDSAP